MKSRVVSRWAIVFASLWIIIHSVVRAVLPIFGFEYGLTMTDIIGSGVTLVIVWTPIYRSVWLDKKVGIKKRLEANNEVVL